MARRKSAKITSKSRKTPTKTTGVKKTASKGRAARQPREGMPLDRKLDIIGVILAVLGILTLLSLLSPVRSGPTEGWANTLGMAFGLGKFFFPLLLVLSGLWLVLRNFERVPQFAPERVLGFTLLFAVLLAGAHLLSSLGAEGGAFELAQAGKGGGYTGAALLEALNWALGTGGAVIALLALLVIALALTLDLTVAEMVRWAPPLIIRLQDWVMDTVEDFQARQGRRGGKMPVQPGYIPESPASGVGPEGIGAAASIHPARPPSTGLQTGSKGETREWTLPAIENILDEGGEVRFDDEIDLGRARVIEETLVSFGAPARVIEINRGPTITQFGVEPDYIESRGGRMRVRVSKISSLADDLALALSARTVRIQAPVPGKGFVGIEVPNDEASLVTLRDIIQSAAFKQLKSPLRFALGLNVSGHAVAADLSVMPHLLIAGATGSGKSVCVNALINCLLLHNTPNEMRLIMVDPKRVELTGYNYIPHLLAPVVVELEKVVTVLQWVTREMDMRYHKLAEAGCRNILEYNNLQEERYQKKLPYLVVIIDELADLMMMAPDETERTVTRLAQLARATGIHLVISTQRPSVDVVTGLIKANFPARIAFAVASGVDSRVILDQPGAERLLGRGDMLFQAPDAPAPVRLQGVYVSESEILRLVAYWQRMAGVPMVTTTAAGDIVGGPPPGVPLKQMPMWEEMAEEENADPLMDEAVDLARRQGRASISMLQRRLRIGYTRAARIIETMEEKGIVGPPNPGTGTREILDYGPAAPPEDE